MTHSLDDDLAFALRLADTARAISLARFRGRLIRRTKPDGSIVTDADEAVEDALRAAIRQERPGDAVLGEERGQTGSGSRRWVLDGIDGTNSFANGDPYWATLIALEEDGEIVVGVCDQSPRDRRYFARRGGGAFLEEGGAPGRRLRVSSTEQLRRARGFVPSPEWLRDAQARTIAATLADASQPEVPEDHPALLVARGELDFAVFFAMGPWDVAAPSIVVREAGGRFSNLLGRTELSGGAVFSNGRLHDAVLAITAGSSG